VWNAQEAVKKELKCVYTLSQELTEIPPFSKLTEDKWGGQHHEFTFTTSNYFNVAFYGSVLWLGIPG
jgi:hypothetical protein